MLSLEGLNLISSLLALEVRRGLANLDLVAIWLWMCVLRTELDKSLKSRGKLPPAFAGGLLSECFLNPRSRAASQLLSGSVRIITGGISFWRGDMVAINERVRAALWKIKETDKKNFVKRAIEFHQIRHCGEDFGLDQYGVISHVVKK